MRMVRSGQWDAEVLVSQMSRDVCNWLPAPEDGVMHLSADKTRKDKRGRKHPLGLVTRESAHAPYQFGFEMLWSSKNGHKIKPPARFFRTHWD